MVRHVTMLRWKDGVEIDNDDLVRRLKEMPDKINTIKKLAAGPDLGLAGDNADFVLVVDFQRQEDWMDYNKNPVHLAIAMEYIVPNIAERIAVQFDLAE